MKIEEKFQELRERKEGAYMPHVYYGDPSEEFSLQEIEMLVKNGADLLEVGIPFSDPIADGPIFQAACERALKGGMTPEKCLQGIKKLRERGVKIPIILTTYYNIPYVLGVKKFIKHLRKVQAQGIIVPDLPIEEAKLILEMGKKEGIRVILQVNPATSQERLEKIIVSSSGFLYLINIEGVTGVRDSIMDSTIQLIRRVKKQIELPIMAGFGLAKKEQVKAIISAGADGVIIGSALGKIYSRNLTHPEKTLLEIGNFAQRIKKECIEGYQLAKKLDNI